MPPALLYTKSLLFDGYEALDILLFYHNQTISYTDFWGYLYNLFLLFPQKLPLTKTFDPFPAKEPLPPGKERPTLW